MAPSEPLSTIGFWGSWWSASVEMDSIRTFLSLRFQPSSTMRRAVSLLLLMAGSSRCCRYWEGPAHAPARAPPGCRGGAGTTSVSPRSVGMQAIERPLDVALRRVDRIEEPAAHASEEPGIAEARARRDGEPGGEADRMRHPEVAAIGVVLHQDERAAGLQVAADEREHRRLRLHEMERVRHEHAVHAAESERPGEIRRPLVQPHPVEPRVDRGRLGREGAAIGIDGVDRAARSEKVREREGERAGAGPELEPGAARRDRVADERDVVSVVHSGEGGLCPSEAAGPPIPSSRKAAKGSGFIRERYPF